MTRRTSNLSFFLFEALLLLAVVVPVAHLRSIVDRIMVPQGDFPLAEDEAIFILLRSLLLVLVLQAAMALRDLYRWPVILQPPLVVVRLVEAVIIMLVAVPLLHVIMGHLDAAFELDRILIRLKINPFLVMACAGAGFLTAYGLRMRWPRWVARSRFAERFAILGSGPAVDVIQEEIGRRRLPGLEMVGVLTVRDGPPAPGAPPLLSAPNEVAETASRHNLQRVVVSPGTEVPSHTLMSLRLDGIKIEDTASFYEQLTGRLSLESLASPKLFLSSDNEPSPLSDVVKRLGDLVVASLGMILALPLFVVVALAIKLESRGPIFYRQERVGRDGRSFTLAKFRSMRADAEIGTGPVWASTGDARVTRVGHWLRKLRIDEVPQLWSVILNDMSLVGPRPERPFFVNELEDQIPHYAQRHLVKPGVTGWAQINHSYGNTTDDALIKLQYDLYYIKHRSFALDVAIMLRTVKVVVLQQGAV